MTKDNPELIIYWLSPETEAIANANAEAGVDDWPGVPVPRLTLDAPDAPEFSVSSRDLPALLSAAASGTVFLWTPAHFPRRSGALATYPSPPHVRRGGRPGKFTKEQIDEALAAKAEGKNNAEVAKILHRTVTPTPAQRRSVPIVLNYHRKRRTVPKNA